ncbi:hypothetical protein DFH06DRAFT_1141060 [Mycena polygramma]|nr:hypothetical protein DFH06DRAFT_1141060 [Mycena polygramma]
MVKPCKSSPACAQRIRGDIAGPATILFGAIDWFPTIFEFENHHKYCLDPKWMLSQKSGRALEVADLLAPGWATAGNGSVLVKWQPRCVAWIILQAPASTNEIVQEKTGKERRLEGTRRSVPYLGTIQLGINFTSEEVGEYSRGSASAIFQPAHPRFNRSTREMGCRHTNSRARALNWNLEFISLECVSHLVRRAAENQYGQRAEFGIERHPESRFLLRPPPALQLGSGLHREQSPNIGQEQEST